MCNQKENLSNKWRVVEMVQLYSSLYTWHESMADTKEKQELR